MACSGAAALVAVATIGREAGEGCASRTGGVKPKRDVSLWPHFSPCGRRAWGRAGLGACYQSPRYGHDRDTEKCSSNPWLADKDRAKGTAHRNQTDHETQPMPACHVSSRSLQGFAGHPDLRGLCLFGHADHTIEGARQHCLVSFDGFRRRILPLPDLKLLLLHDARQQQLYSRRKIWRDRLGRVRLPAWSRIFASHRPVLFCGVPIVCVS